MNVSKISRYDLLEGASDKLKEAGFIKQYQSRKSEAMYYALPGREKYWLRLAVHKQKKKNVPLGLPSKVVARLTLNSGFLSKLSVDALLVSTIGIYVMKSGAMMKQKEERERENDNTR